MNSPIDMWQSVADAFDQRYQAVTDEQWQTATPCEEWCVRDLVDHAVGVQINFGGSLGSTASEGDDWPTVKAAMEAALATDGVLDGTTEHPAFGEVPKAQVFGIAINDLLIHTWDLARAIGADEELPPDAVAAAYTGLQQLPVEILRSPGRFGAAVDVDDTADQQTQLLGFAGRQP
jgi:uncharacterized protein (TIGR03086 family)